MLSVTLKIALAILATFRLAQLVALDDGPLDIFKMLRLAIGHRAAWAHGSGKRFDVLFWSSFAELFHCPYCLGVWFALAITPLVFIDNVTIDIILVALALAGGQSFLEGFNGRTD